MNVKTIDIDNFWVQTDQSVVIDVRSPKEYRSGHIPGAFNLPLFDNEERSVVGTIYVHEGREAAIEKGLEFVGPKLSTIVQTAKKVAQGRSILFYCWRGGLRSQSMAWLIQTAGLSCQVLAGGYKTWRRAFEILLNKYNWKIIVLGGYTGCGKTDILKELENCGEQVIDLEGLASHKGSVFGGIGQNEQPTSETFENELHARMRRFDPKRPIWCEGESISIGQIYIPQSFFKRMQQSPLVFFEIPTSDRLNRLTNEYGKLPMEALAEAFRKITKRLGYENTQLALHFLQTGNIREAATIALRYYDKCYRHAIEKMMPNAIRIVSDADAPNLNAKRIMNHLKTLHIL